MEKRDMLHYIRLKMMTGLEAYIIGGLERNEAVTEEKKYRFKGGERKSKKKKTGNYQQTIGIIFPQNNTQGEEYRPRVLQGQFGMATLTSAGIEGIGLRGTTGIGTLRKVNCGGKNDWFGTTQLNPWVRRTVLPLASMEI